MSIKKTTITDAVRKVVQELLEIKLDQWRMMSHFEEIGLHLPGIFEPPLLDLAATLCELPADNTSDISLDDVRNGTIPDWVYSRDWLIDEFHGVINGEYSVEQFIEVLLTDKSLEELYG